MTGKWRLLIFPVAALWIFARTTMRAFATPWTWNLDQGLFIWLALCVALTAGVWVTVWVRGGNEAVAVRWERTLESSAAGMAGKRFWRYTGFWIVVAVVLVFIFTLTKH
jgi:hypothetical protein